MRRLTDWSERHSGVLWRSMISYKYVVMSRKAADSLALGQCNSAEMWLAAMLSFHGDVCYGGCVRACCPTPVVFFFITAGCAT